MIYDICARRDRFRRRIPKGEFFEIKSDVYSEIRTLPLSLDDEEDLKNITEIMNLLKNDEAKLSSSTDAHERKMAISIRRRLRFYRYYQAAILKSNLLSKVGYNRSDDLSTSEHLKLKSQEDDININNIYETTQDLINEIDLLDFTDLSETSSSEEDEENERSLDWREYDIQKNNAGKE